MKRTIPKPYLYALIFCGLAIIPLLNITIFLPAALYQTLKGMRKRKHMDILGGLLLLLILIAYGAAMFFFIHYSQDQPFDILWILVSLGAMGFAYYSSKRGVRAS